MKMKTPDFPAYLSRYLSSYLPSSRGCSPRTIDSYRQAFIGFLSYMDSVKGIPPRKLSMPDFTYENVTGFLDWLENTKGNSASSRNQRLAPLKGFASYLIMEFPEYIDECTRIMSIPAKKHENRTISYMKPEGITLILSMPDASTDSGLRDKLMLSLLYTAGLRVTELISLRVKDVSFSEPRSILVHGKGSKQRLVPLARNMVPMLRDYFNRFHISASSDGEKWLFENHHGWQFSRQGINYLVDKYADKARGIDSSLIPADCSPHKFRHSIAMEMLDNGIDLIYIKDFLSHENISTTEIYARANSAKTREAVEKAAERIIPTEEPIWIGNKDILSWLKTFSC